MTAPRLIKAGKIRYQTSFVANPAYGGGGRIGVYSRELHAKIQRSNVPESIVVDFNGEQSRTEEVNVDYGFRSLSFRLRKAGSKKVTYCKEFPYFGFCIEYPEPVRANGRGPLLTPLGETATIAGLTCRKAEYQDGPHLFVWYSEEISANDPTGAVLTLEGVPGLITQTEEITTSQTVDSTKRTTVTEMDFDSQPASELFSVPAHYRVFPDVDAARAENRRLLEDDLARETTDELIANFAGNWLFDTPNDQIRLEITQTGAEEFQFRKTVLTAPHDAPGRVTDQLATLKGRTLIVEEPPNYQLYKLENTGQKLRLVGNELFTFTRV
ncbi:MAG TPA: hypothetical protein VFM63_00345 [Pyrinomonadaceae bacterium]|nr:hypothetical protein [Pyrinomonadaceae bacterium]